MTKRFFAYESEYNGFQLFSTLEEAMSEAQAQIDEGMDPGGQWPDEEIMSQICCGEVIFECQAIVRKPWADHLKDLGKDYEDDRVEPHPFDEFIEYGLVKLEDETDD